MNLEKSPRVTFYYDWFSHPKYQHLFALTLARIKDPSLASDLTLGIFMNAFIVGQESFLKTGEIPSSVWESKRFRKELIECGFVEKTNTGYRFVDSETLFKWKKGLQKSGQQGGLAKASNAKRRQAKLSPPKRTLANVPSVSVSVSSSGSVSISDSVSKKEIELEIGEGQRSCASPPDDLDYFFSSLVVKPEITQPSTNELVDLFCNEYQRRYASQYLVTHKEELALGRLFKTLGNASLFERIVRAYLSMPDRWFVQRRHDVITLESNLAKVAHFEQTGVVVTDSSLRAADRKVEQSMILEKIKRGEL